ncbi:hypothetical protein Droror1_Dr00020502 [Drosera rotundifolia]
MPPPLVSLVPHRPPPYSPSSATTGSAFVLIGDLHFSLRAKHGRKVEHGEGRQAYASSPGSNQGGEFSTGLYKAGQQDASGKES